MEEHILSPILEAIPQIIEIVGATHQLQLYSPNASGPKHLEKDAHCVEPGTRICAKCTIARVIFTVERACILCVGACMRACVCARVCWCACVCALPTLISMMATSRRRCGQTSEAGAQSEATLPAQSLSTQHSGRTGKSSCGLCHYLSSPLSSEGVHQGSVPDLFWVPFF